MRLKILIAVGFGVLAAGLAIFVTMPRSANSRRAIREDAAPAPVHASESAGPRETTATKELTPEALNSNAEAYVGRTDAELIHAVRAWADTDAAAAIQWAVGIPDERLKNELINAIGNEIATANPRLALSFAGSFSSRDKMAEYVTQIAQGWASRDPSGAGAWASHIEDRKLRDDVQGAIAIEMAQLEPKAAAEYVASQMTEGEAQNRNAITVALRWAYMDPPAAKAWANDFPSGGLRDAVLKAVNSVADRR